MEREKIEDKLVYSTVRILCDEVSYGTGFLVSKKLNEENQIVKIVTNKHVVSGYNTAQIMFPRKDANGNPILGDNVVVNFPDLQSVCKYHKDAKIDICTIDINPNLYSHIFFVCIDSSAFINKNNVKELVSIEDILMIGYPNALIDEKNCRPIVRKGITATDIKLDYNDTPNFLIDAACYPGSSGSPVFIKRNGLSQEQNDKGINVWISSQYYLAGILHSGPMIMVNGNIVEKEISTSIKTSVETKTTMNLGYVTKADKIEEMLSIENIGW